MAKSDPDPFALQSANKVFIMYCTSDGHMGDAGASATTHGWHFRGAAVLRATISELVQKHGLGASGGGAPPQRIIYGGGSAGSRGAMVHLDYVDEDLKALFGAFGEVEEVSTKAVVDWLVAKGCFDMVLECMVAEGLGRPAARQVLLEDWVVLSL